MLLAAISFSGVALADHVTIHVNDAWSRATPPTAEVGAAYFSLAAHGSGMDRLISASAPVAARAEMHTHEVQGSLMRMRKMDAVEVHAQAPVQFAPGGNHIMLMGLKAPLKEGDRFPLTLIFEKAGQIVVDVHVKGVGAMTSSDVTHKQGMSGGHGSASHSQMKAESKDHSGHTMKHDHSMPNIKKE
jgi:copper(I)-binding protein